MVFISLIVFAQFATTVAVLLAADRTAVQDADSRLDAVNRAWTQWLIARERRFQDTVRVAASDAALRAAIADPTAIESVLSNQSARFHAHSALLINPNGKVFGSAPLDALLRRPAALLPQWGFVNGQLLQLVFSPVPSTSGAATLGLGFVIDDGALTELAGLTGVSISVIGTAGTSANAIVATSLGAQQRDDLGKLFGPGVVRASRDRQVTTLAGEEYVTKRYESDAGQFALILQLPSAQVLIPVRSVRRDLFVLGSVVSALCVVFAVICARLLSQPLRTLSAAARSLDSIKPRGAGQATLADDELSQLAGVFHSLAQRAHYDALTGLPNRSLALDRISESITRSGRVSEPFSIVFIDLNGFKKINDALGHEMGDLVLRKTAKRLLRSMRPGDTVARLGGDEFLLLLENVAQNAAVKIVDGLIPVIALPMQSPDGPIQIGMSAGIAVYPDHARDKGTLLRLADAAMYESKSRNCGPVVCKPAARGDAGDRAGEFGEDPLATGSSSQWVQRDLQTHQIKPQNS